MKLTSANSILFTAAAAFLSSGSTFVQAEERSVMVYALNNCGEDFDEVKFMIGDGPVEKSILDDTCTHIGMEYSLFVPYELNGTTNYFDCMNDQIENSLSKCSEHSFMQPGPVCIVNLCDEDGRRPKREEGGRKLKNLPAKPLKDLPPTPETREEGGRRNLRAK